MKFESEQKTLSKILTSLIGIVERKVTIAALANVAIIASEGQVTFKATDLDIEYTTVTRALVSAEGSTTVNAAMFGEVVKRMAAGSLVSLEQDDHRLLIKAGRAKADLPTLPIGDFPHMASSEYDVTFSIPTPELLRIFNLAKGCMSDQEVQYHLQGIYLHNNNGNMIGVSTNGQRLAHIVGPSVVDFPGVIVPRKTVAEVIKADAIGDVQVSVSETKIKFDFGSSVIVSKVIDGTFPVYATIIPQNNPNRVSVDGDAIKAATNCVAVVSSERVTAVKLDVTADSIMVSARGADTGYAEDVIDAVLEGVPVTVGFNAKYLAEVIAVADGDVTLELGEDMTPAVIRGSDSGALWVVMPMRV